MASGHEIQVDTTLDRRETSTQTSGECHDSLNRLTVTIHRALVQKSFHEAGGQCSYSKKATSRTNICRLMANFFTSSSMTAASTARTTSSADNTSSMCFISCGEQAKLNPLCSKLKTKSPPLPSSGPGWTYCSNKSSHSWRFLALKAAASFCPPESTLLLEYTAQPSLLHCKPSKIF